MKSSTVTRQSEIKREWHMIDLKDKTLGRISVEIAKLLMGKSKPYFVKNLDCGDYVVAVNAREIKVTGKKEEQKKYFRHSGYPGGLKSQTLGQLRLNKSDEIIRHAVSGMLPQNRLKSKMLKRLHVFAGDKHSHQDKLKIKS